MLGVTNKAVSKWENGKSMPDIGIIPELCNLPNVLSEFVIIANFLETNTFQSGILNGVFAGLQLSGTCFLVAGVVGLIYSIRTNK